MIDEGLWVPDSLTGEPVFISYDDLDDDLRYQLFKPIGGFCYPMDQFTKLELPKAPFWIQDWLPKQGKMLIYAKRKAGKSYLSYQMARCLGSGLPFLGMKTEQAKVLLLQFELGIGVLQLRLRDDTKQSYPNVTVGTHFSLKLDTKGGMETFCAALEAIEPEVLILDPLYKIMSGDENETKDMKAIVEAMDHIITMYNCSIVIFHHAGKDSSRGARGSSTIEDWVDTALEMSKISDAGQSLQVKIVAKALRHASDPTEDLKLEMGPDFEFHPIVQPATVKERALEYLTKKNCIVKRSEILDAGIGSNASLQNALNELCEEGTVEKTERGEYKVK